MKYYSIKKILMFFELQVKSDFVVIRKIVSAINSDLSVEDTRDLIFKNLENSGMTADFFEEIKPISTSQIKTTEPDIVMFPGSGEFMAVYQEFRIQIGDRSYVIPIYMN